KNYHVITTNADNAFYAAQFDMDKVFRIQGEYGLWQCSEHCHQQTYHDEALIRQMVAEQSDMKRSEERRVGKEGRARSGESQAEDGIRDRNVTGVQTCALPI